MLWLQWSFLHHKMLSSIYCHGNQPRRTFLVHYFHITPAVSVFVHMKKSISLNFLHVSPQGSHVLVFSHRFYPRKYFFSVKHHFLIHLLLHTDVKTMISKPPFPLASWLCCLNIKHLLWRLLTVQCWLALWYDTFLYLLMPLFVNTLAGAAQIND